MLFMKKVLFLFLLVILTLYFLYPKDSPKPTIIDEKVKYPQDYTIVMVGDSMTETLGNSDEIRKFLKEYYPDKTFEVLNYGFGSTNILTLKTRLLEKTFHGREFRPITEIDFDLILIESFGHNPLSHLSMEEGLREQTKALEEAVQILKDKNPEGRIVFVATIAPSKAQYGRGQVELTPEARQGWVLEREAYIKNHIKFAMDNNIPLINIFEKSKVEGDLNLDLVRTEDYIHPSPTGTIFISKIIADFLFQEKIL
ncbi:hypothetical protein A3C59_05340 [Candidatus Daviesbacteria bacterium RIFCSPHIGHO2_02_FULL_36_13]|uniref:SGNH hydrolase-type esterase domain-containing protein n=1 Tax=Candidatus Daviesbacteria bacterium RIFCSPHIGHO2_02_FULL_36_13 TaxID=1797768 RepID=A0A1F5JSE0_9BACT|nr:MAG: hypothetical protein A3C59_05340 [Candidatus Daviesbacteria bacterium RIFCSPHIGHO2_02_FULL_36_13]